MFRKFIFYTIILLFISIISTLFPYINSIISRVNYPLDIVFFEIRNNYLLLTKNASYLERLEYIISDYTKSINIKNENIDLKLSLIPGIFINEDSKYYYIKTSKDVKNGEIAFTKDGIILGFVVDSLNENKVIRKLGWGNTEIFGNYKNIDLLIKESRNGNIIINIPEGFNIFTNGEEITLLISNSNWINKTLFIKGTVYKKSRTIYYLNPTKLQSNIIFFSEFGVK
ncbi:hypothetical protein SAMN02745164_00979 [Marinitoga hydrogenitolerans DSM 16785]|uniref:Uncharacterized protein n=1 Tax=Marinitoga hydrogenitolerans (strain DSM 16785 / JCM 12826 / AT1271) TaxID=1122195 RepID=A0A1M4VPS9_MARH1|nr:hypothetical protein [Marinitoga hydrogenitolerans]SHE70938.1 hypothetical protein SAMN02745164_00979 [Marinitoga hydrogenitolerans DSM 16785]